MHSKITPSLSVKIILRDDIGRILLLKRSMKSKNNAGRWDLPGGKLDACETFDVAIAREVLEETGLEYDLVGPLGTSQSKLGDKWIVYLILEGKVKSTNVQLSDEHDEYAWLTPQEALNYDILDQFKESIATLAPN